MCSSDLVAPYAAITSKFRKPLIVYDQAQIGLFNFKEFFVRSAELDRIYQNKSIGNIDIDNMLRKSPQAEAAAVLTSSEEVLVDLERLAGHQTAQSSCNAVVRTGSFFDRILFSLNPTHNTRRRPTWYLICERRATDEIAAIRPSSPLQSQ